MTFERPKNVKPFRAENSATPRIANAIEVRNATETAAEIWLTGEVGWDIWANDVIPQLQAIDGDGKEITIFLNSPGGDVFDGYVIGNFIAQMKATVTVRVMALAASIATFMSVKASRVEMPSNSMFMIHEAWAFSWGRADELRNTATLVDKLNDQLAAAYTAKRVSTLGSADGEDFRALMASGDVWLTAQEALALGLIDAVVDSVDAKASVRADILDALSAPEAVRAMAEEPEAEEVVVAEEEESPVADAADEVAHAADPEPEADQEPAPLAEEAQAEIQAACRLMNMSDRAEGFIAARATMDTVRSELFRARAEADAKTEVDNRQEPTGTPAARVLSAQERIAQAADKQRAAFRAIQANEL
ncbi:MAG: Clp protease ClpP [Paracoccus sp.]|nr:Clp protease ClpP [Paracoccus sp. (in: a-proteobacteria)]